MAAPYSQSAPSHQTIPPVGQIFPNIGSIGGQSQPYNHNNAMNTMNGNNGINGMNMNGMPPQPPHPMHMGGMNCMPPLMHHQSYSSQVQGQPQNPQRPLEPVSFEKDGKKFTLVVAQEPIRARMCGFGDKDRRPITPPPCIQLLVTDAITGKDIDPNEVDASYFVLTVDLWDSNGTQEVNLVRHSNSSPAVSISAATTTPYPPPPERPYLGLLNAAQLQAHYLANGDPQRAATLNPYLPAGMGTQVIQQWNNPNQNYSSAYPQSPAGLANPINYNQSANVPVPIVPAPTNGMFTRNLIGSLSVNAFKLQDPNGKTGFWFVLQDLSVRTEGTFRLKMNFVDVMNAENAGTLNTGKAPVLATCYSEAFTVYSAKKFPGVIESTALSKCFAQQGIKIPIRKDVKIANLAEYEADE